MLNDRPQGFKVISQLKLSDFRNYRHAQWEFKCREILLHGPNGVGKSNLLEAIYFAAILRSFRGASVRELCRIGVDSLHIELELAILKHTELLTIEQHVSGKRRLFIDGVPVRKSSDFIREFRAVALAPEDKNISGGAALFRRRFFDMTISVLEPEYLSALQHYTLALRERNALLRSPEWSGKGMASSKLSAMFVAFENIMAENGALIGRYRQEYTQKIAAKLAALREDQELTVEYNPTAPVDPVAYCDKLARDRERDARRGATFSGPQLDDWRISLQGKELRYYGSSGQLRSAALYLKLAELQLVRESVCCPVVALVDDVTGELDRRSSEKFFHALAAADQIFFTFTEVPNFANFTSAQHIEIGN